MRITSVPYVRYQNRCVILWAVGHMNSSVLQTLTEYVRLTGYEAPISMFFDDVCDRCACWTERYIKKIDVSVCLTSQNGILYWGSGDPVSWNINNDLELDERTYHQNRKNFLPLPYVQNAYRTLLISSWKFSASTWNSKRGSSGPHLRKQGSPKLVQRAKAFWHGNPALFKHIYWVLVYYFSKYTVSLRSSFPFATINDLHLFPFSLRD